MCNKIIGITGKSGSGKSTIAKMINEIIPNSCVIDVDKIGHEALRNPKILKNLLKKFGDQILDDIGNIDRKKLGAIVFKENSKMKDLTDETYHYILQRIDNIVKSAKGIVILDWILLPEHPIWKNCNLKILIKSDSQIRRDKVIKRDNISLDYFNAREKTSIEYDLKQFDLIFSNDYMLSTSVNIAHSIVKSLNKYN